MATNNNRVTICTTTINSPTEELKYFMDMATRNENVFLVVAGDKKTPDAEYLTLFQDVSDKCIYLTPEGQEELSMDVSNAIGWNCIQRRNMAFLYAVKELETDWVLSMDDDNLPYPEWKTMVYNVTYGGPIIQEVELYEPSQAGGYVSDPLQVTNVAGKVWHRGFPQESQGYLHHDYKTKQDLNLKDFDVIAMMWDGDLDVDAMCRLSSPESSFGVKLKTPEYWTFPNTDTIFNSQNTFVKSKLIKHWPMLPFVGRMDDIWAAYLVQTVHDGELKILFTHPTVVQDRKDHKIYKDIEGELIGMQHAHDIWANVGDAETVDALKSRILPEKTQAFLKVWESQFE